MELAELVRDRAKVRSIRWTTRRGREFKPKTRRVASGGDVMTPKVGRCMCPERRWLSVATQPCRRRERRRDEVALYQVTALDTVFNKYSMTILCIARGDRAQDRRGYSIGRENNTKRWHASTLYQKQRTTEYAKLPMIFALSVACVVTARWKEW